MRFRRLHLSVRLLISTARPSSVPTIHPAAASSCGKATARPVGTTPLRAGSSEVSNPEDFVQLNNKLFFGNGDGDLYMTDGTSGGTTLVTGYDDAEVNGTAAENADERLSVVSGEVYFASDGYLYKTDGTTTAQVGNGNTYGVYSITPMGVETFIILLSMMRMGQELWKSDGTTETLVKDINAGSGDSDPQNLVASGNELFFEAKPDGDTQQIFATDGTSAGTTQLSQTLNGAGGFTGPIYSGRKWDSVHWF